MKTYLKRLGDSFVLEIDRKVLEELHIDPDKPIEMDVFGDMLTVSTGERDDRSARLDRVLNHIESKYAATLKGLSE